MFGIKKNTSQTALTDSGCPEFPVGVIYHSLNNPADKTTVLPLRRLPNTPPSKNHKKNKMTVAPLSINLHFHRSPSKPVIFEAPRLNSSFETLPCSQAAVAGLIHSTVKLLEVRCAHNALRHLLVPIRLDSKREQRKGRGVLFVIRGLSRFHLQPERKQRKESEPCFKSFILFNQLPQEL